MAEYAVINDGIVSNVIVGESGQAYVLGLLLQDADEVIEVTDETGAAFIGGDVFDGRFRHVSPFPSWVWDADTWSWMAPVPTPSDGKIYVWDEATGSWIEYVPPVVEETV